MSKQQTAAASSPAPEYAEIPHKAISPSPTNPRKFYNQEQLDELAASIKEKGILEPLLIRRALNGNGHKIKTEFELIAGERRWRAAELAGLATVPAMIRVMTDEEVLDAQIHENLHRADVHPMDEAYGYQHLLKVVEGLTVKELARRVAKSERYVAQRLSLTSLIEPAVKDFMEGLITLGHATQIARLSPEVQQAALDHCYETERAWDNKNERWIETPDKEEQVTVADLNEWIGRNLTLDLTKAPWSLEDAELVPVQGPCSTCPANTATNQLLFGDAAKSAICTNPEGYERKMQAWTIKEVEKLRATGATTVLSLTNLYSIDANSRRRHNLPEDAKGTSEYHVIEKKKDRCEFALPGVFVQGNRRGQTAWVCTEPKCKDHKGRISSSSSLSSGERTEKSPAEKQKMYDRKQELFDARVAEPVRRRTLKAILEVIKAPHVLTPAVPPEGVTVETYHRYFSQIAWEHFVRIPGDTQHVIYEVLGWDDLATGKGNRYDYSNHEKEKKAIARIEQMPFDELFRFHLLCAFAHHGENLGIIGGARDQSVIIKLAEQHGVNYKLFDAEERLNQAARKYKPVHERYLIDVTVGIEGVKPPKVYGDPPKEFKEPNFKSTVQRVLWYLAQVKTDSQLFQLQAMRGWQLATTEGIKQIGMSITDDDVRAIRVAYAEAQQRISTQGAPAPESKVKAKADHEVANEIIEIISNCKTHAEIETVRQQLAEQSQTRKEPLNAVQIARIQTAFTEQSRAIKKSKTTTKRGSSKKELLKAAAAASKKKSPAKSAAKKKAGKSAAKITAAKKHSKKASK